MNNKIFRFLMLFVSICVASISTLFAVSFGLSNVTLDHDNQDLTQENEKLNDAVSDLQNTINMDPASAVVSYEVDGKIWKIDVTKKGDSVYLPTGPDTDTHAFDGWKIDGAGDKMTGNTTIKENTKFVANMVEKDWLKVNFEGLASSELYGSYVWTDGKNTYLSSGSTQYVLGADDTWEKITWYGLTNTSLYANGIWTDGEKIYYSSSSHQYVLKDNDTWEKITWNGLTSFSGYNVWTDGTNIYYSYNSNQYVLGADNTWETVTWTGISNFNGEYVWTDGKDSYYSSGSSHYVLGADNTWTVKSWTGLTSFDGCYIYNVGDKVYCNTSTALYTLQADNTWVTVLTWPGYANVSVRYMWTDGVNLYHSQGNNYQLVIDVDNNDFRVKAWNGLPNTYLEAKNIWTDGTKYYYSRGLDQYEYDVTTGSWRGAKWTGMDNSDYYSFWGNGVWTDGVDTYYSTNGTNYLLKENYTWEKITWNEDGINVYVGAGDIWTDGVNIYYSNQYVFDVATRTWSNMTWNGYSGFNAYDIWTDGENIYYGNQYVLDVATHTWESVTFTGMSSYFSISYIWTYGENVYYSNGENNQYILDKATRTWTKKDDKWWGIYSLYGEYIWTDGTNVYSSSGTSNYVLNKNKQ